MTHINQPQDLSQSFAKLLDTHYPEQLIRALSLLDQDKLIQKKIHFIAQADTDDEGSQDVAELLKKFNKLDNLVVTQGPDYDNFQIFPEIKKELELFDNPSGAQFLKLQLAGVILFGEPFSKPI